MHIRKAAAGDLPAMEKLYAEARAHMVREGNPTQWGKSNPRRAWLEQDIAAGCSYVCVQGEEVLGTFFFAMGPDPTYAYIEGGAWPDDEPYGVVHRLAAGGRRRGAGEFCLRWCLSRCASLRIDTHQDNRSMRGLLDKLGFVCCGTIYVQDGTPRLAYQRKGEAAPASVSVGHRAEDSGH